MLHPPMLCALMLQAHAPMTYFLSLSLALQIDPEVGIWFNGAGQSGNGLYPNCSGLNYYPGANAGDIEGRPLGAD